MRALYSLVMWLLTPIALGYFAVRGLRDSRWLRGWSERLGFRGGTDCALIIHCASVGEVNAAAPLVRALAERPGLSPLLLTCFTPTGAARARELFGARVEVRHPPLDLPGATRRLLAACRPRALVIMETEVWPNLLHAAGRSGVPVVLANARISERSVRGYRRAGKLARDAFTGLTRVLAQTAGDAARFRDCGVIPDRLVVTGNLKFDATLPRGLAEAGEALRSGWGAERPVLVAGSTREGEEDLLLIAFRRVLDTHPGALMVVAPRHPERFERVAARLSATGPGVARHSLGEPPGPAQAILLLDALGVLMPHYAAADVAFVGGTLVPVGGHNPLEPAALGRPVLLGPHRANVGEVADALLSAGAALEVTDADTLAAALARLFGDAALRGRMGEAGRTLVANGQGALQRTLAEIEKVISPGSR